MSKRWIALIFALIISFAAGAKCQTAVSDRISIQAGISIYGDPGTGPNVYVEFPFSVNRNQFLFLSTDTADTQVRAAIYAEVVISDTLGNNQDSVSTYFYSRAVDSATAAAGNIKLFNKLTLMIPPGVYKANLRVIDVSSKREGSFLYDRIVIPPVVADRLALSGLELAFSIKAAGDENTQANPRMIKNGWEIIPSPLGVFSQEDTAIYVYAELYNLPFDSTKKSQFKLNYKAFRSDGTLQMDYGDMLEDKPGGSAVIANILKIAGWEPGKYDLKLSATDLESGSVAEAAKRFIVFPKSGVLPGMVTYSQKSSLDTAGAATMSNILHFLLSAQELAIFNSLTDSGKVRYANQFLKDKDPTPGTMVNEYWESAFRRYQYANEHFSSLPEFNDGWRMDRGRVLMQYGDWDERDEIAAPAYERPWERWYYRSIQGGVLFIFEDNSGYGDYKLVHSTAKGEIYNSSWETKIKNLNLEIY